MVLRSASPSMAVSAPLPFWSWSTILLLLLLLLPPPLSPSEVTVPSSLHKASKGVAGLDLQEVVTTIVRRQFNTTSPFSDKQPATLAGLFPSEVRIHFYGEQQIMALADKHVLPDLSSLATLLTLNALVEALVKTPVKKPPMDSLVLALKALDHFRSPSFGESKSALTVFWPVHTKDTAPEKWVTSSENAVKGGKDLNPFLLLDTALNDCQDKCPVARAGLQHVQNDSLCLAVFNQSLSEYAQRHNFPPDVTSSFANLALGALLQAGGDDLSSVLWKSQNANYSRLLQDVFQFSYRPLSAQPAHNVIDSRMYYIIHNYLNNKTSSDLEHAAFVTNWIPQTSPEGRVVYGGQTLPAYNTIDFFGTATFLFAVTTSVLTELIDVDPTVTTLLRSNLDLMTWIVSNGRQDEMDLLLTSHPSRFQLYWMLSRTMFEMESARIQNKETYQLLQEFYTKWNRTVRHYVTEAVLQAIKDGGLDEGGNPLAYVDDILTPVKVKDKNAKQPAGDDRLFATATAASCLLSAWTVHDTQHQLLFLPNTPNDVALATKGLVNYVTSKYQKEDTSLVNVLQSTVHKHCQSLPYWYPSNSVVLQTGESFSGSSPTPDVLFGMRGKVSPDKYQTMLDRPHYGHRVSNAMEGLNTSSALFFFWSSPAYTEAMCLLAAAQMKNTKGQAKDIDSLMGSFETDQD